MGGSFIERSAENRASRIPDVEGVDAADKIPDIGPITDRHHIFCVEPSGADGVPDLDGRRWIRDVNRSKAALSRLERSQEDEVPAGRDRSCVSRGFPAVDDLGHGSIRDIEHV